MALVREFESRIITEADNIWAETGLEDNPRVQVIGTVCTCRVRGSESGLLRQITVTIPPGESVEGENAKALFEECYKNCEMALKKDLAESKKRLLKECMNGR